MWTCIWCSRKFKIISAFCRLPCSDCYQSQYRSTVNAVNIQQVPLLSREKLLSRERLHAMASIISAITYYHTIHTSSSVPSMLNLKHCYAADTINILQSQAQKTKLCTLHVQKHAHVYFICAKEISLSTQQARHNNSCNIHVSVGFFHPHRMHMAEMNSVMTD